MLSREPLLVKRKSALIRRQRNIGRWLLFGSMVSVIATAKIEGVPTVMLAFALPVLLLTMAIGMFMARITGFTTCPMCGKTPIWTGRSIQWTDAHCDHCGFDLKDPRTSDVWREGDPV